MMPRRTAHSDLISAVARGEILHEIGEDLATVPGEGVVDGSAHAPSIAVALEPIHRQFGRFGDELLVQVFAGGAEGDVHVRATVGTSDSPVEPAGLIDRIVDELGLLCVAL